jgi:multiple sugar transport system ATP-binding protein
VFQLFALYPHLTAYDNIAFPLRATRENAAEIDKKVRAVAKSLQIEHLLTKRPSALSGGDMLRVAIG